MSAFHQEHSHGHAFHGEHARHLMLLHKRDSHGTQPVMHVPVDDNRKKFLQDVHVVQSVDTIASVVVVTDTGAVQPTPVADVPTSSAAQPTDPAVAAAAAYASAKAAAGQPAPPAAAVPTSSAIDAAATPAPTAEDAAAAAESTSTSHDAAKPAGASHGMTSGGKAGIAFGVLLVLALVGGLAFFYWRRRKARNDLGKKVDEKHGSFFDRGLSSGPELRRSLPNSHTAVTAPRLSLRPVTQLLPNLAGNNGTQMSEKPKENPFDDAAVISDQQASQAQETRSNHSQKSSMESGDSTSPSSQVSTAAAVPVAAGAPGPQGPNNVHRVQLDFKPSMDDELELTSGQLVRMLHEYDDGWALCIRMDRSQQGVCPRTCLSKMPVKPRPQGPGPRPMNGPPHNGNAPRPYSPHGPPPPNGMVPRPLTPNGHNRERSQTMGRASPAPQERMAGTRERSQSSAVEGAAMPSRKPVPGQAM